MFPDRTLTSADRALFLENIQNASPPFGFQVARSEPSADIIAWASLLPAFSHPLKRNSEAEISVYVDRSAAQNGVGARLTRSLLRSVDASTFDAIWGFALTTNNASIRMCVNAGMKVCGETTDKTILVYSANEQ